MQTFVEMLRGASCVLQTGASCTSAQFAVTCSGFVSARLALSTQVSRAKSAGSVATCEWVRLQLAAKSSGGIK